jgi:CRISPR-associated exonuclease Cas4
MSAAADDRDRLRALTDLVVTLLVEAAAGTGKTSLLAGRVIFLLASNVAPREIAAITFTELAAGELRARISRYLDELLAGKIPEELELALPRGLSLPQREALESARLRLDQLTCTTIHGFCHDLLRSYAVEAGVDPGADILDAVQADFAFDTIFERWWRRRLDEPRPPGDPIALVARGDPIRAEKLLRGFAEFRRDHRTARPLAPDIDSEADLHFSECVREFRRWFNAVQGPDQANEDVIELEQLAAHFAGRFNPLPGFDQLWGLAHPPTLKIMRKDSLELRPYQRRGVWQRAHRGDGSRLFDEAHTHFERCGAAFRTLVGRIATAIISVFSAELNGLLEEYEAFKRHAAVLDFDDLLFTCREVLRQHPNVRRAAADRFRRILVDEFQDTDPVQCEIIFLLTSSEDDTGPWSERRLLAGRLFMVGDPKQAIYRFRGADLATYLQARRAIEGQFPGNILRIARNFRSRSPILEYINLCFAQPLAAQESGYVALEGTLGAAQHGLPCVAKVTVEIPPQTWVDGIRDEEAAIVAETCARLIGNVKVRGSHGELRMLAPGDIALLAPAGRELWRYERALEEAGLPFVSQAGKNLFRRQEAQDVVALVRALADTRDTLALGALLRGPLVGLTEQELLDITVSLPAPEGSEDFPRLSLNTDPSAVQHAVARETLETLRDLRRRVRSITPALLLSEAIERLRVRAKIMARSPDQASRALANIDGLLERARVYGVRGFRQFARDLDDDWAGGAGHTEGALDAEGQAIEIVTIHSSKGLEWPIVIPINTPSQFRRPAQFVHRRSDDTLHWALGDVAPPSLSGALNAEGQEAAHERLRLLYVACTRAMDMLVLPHLTWKDERSWASQLDFKLEDVSELSLGHLKRQPFVPPAAIPNGQSAQIFAEEQSKLEEASRRIRWIRPSDGDADILPVTVEVFGDETDAREPARSIVGGSLRGVILHKLMEEFATGELADTVDIVQRRAGLLLHQLLVPGDEDAPRPDAKELADTALRTWSLPEIAAYRGCLIPELPVYGPVTGSAETFVSGRADAVAYKEGALAVVFDWKSDVAPSAADGALYAGQLAQYLRVLGGERGAIVYMTSGLVQWVAAAGRSGEAPRTSP